MWYGFFPTEWQSHLSGEATSGEKQFPYESWVACFLMYILWVWKHYITLFFRTPLTTIYCIAWKKQYLECRLWVKWPWNDYGLRMSSSFPWKGNNTKLRSEYYIFLAEHNFVNLKITFAWIKWNLSGALISTLNFLG